jgi:hypothetical protein
MPTLKQLQGKLLRCEEETSNEKDDKGMYIFRREDGSIGMWSPTPSRTVFHPVKTVAKAHGVRFLCPKSFAKNGGPKGTHSVYIFFTGSPYAGRNRAGQEVRWQVVGGSTIDDLQLSPSIQEQDEGMPAEHQCNWHGFVGTSGVPPGHAA